jgi:multidrug efflux pump subunit AcrA (membrane-fusion protein)
MKKFTKWALVALLSFASCTATPAEVSTYQAIAPLFTAYVENDGTLTPMERQRRLDLVMAWGVRLAPAVAK